ncbi:MAG: hypothetical protein NUV93_09085, partial [Firmicutes bacterium]|nr:hypothetical protein [Bacillota bacterium]
ADGWVFDLAMTSRQVQSMPRQRVSQRLAESARAAARLGAGIVGMGSFSVSHDVAQRVSDAAGVAVTCGHNYEVAATLDAAGIALGFMDKALASSAVAVFGAHHPHAAAFARIIACEAGSLTLFGEPRQVRELSLAITAETGLVPRMVGDLVSAAAQWDLVVVCGECGRRLNPAHLAPGTVVCFIAGSDWPPAWASALPPGVLAITGGVVRLPGEFPRSADDAADPPTCDPRSAEAVLLALEERYDGWPGWQVTADRVDEVRRLGRKHGLVVSGVVSVGRASTFLDKDIPVPYNKSWLFGGYIWETPSTAGRRPASAFAISRTRFREGRENRTSGGEIYSFRVSRKASG